MYAIKQVSGSEYSIHINLSAVFALSEVDKLNWEFIEYIKALGNPVNLILDISNIETFPSDIMTLRKASTPIAELHPITNIVSMNNNPILKFITHSVTQGFR